LVRIRNQKLPNQGLDLDRFSNGILAYRNFRRVPSCARFGSVHRLENAANDITTTVVTHEAPVSILDDH
jgi:hypothetical protein